MLLNKFFKNSILINKSLSNFKANNPLYTCQSYNFARTTTTPLIFRGDHVVVLPPWKNARLNRYAQKIIQNNNKDEAIPRYGVVKKMMRSKGQAIISGINKREQYTSPYDIELVKKAEMGKFEEIKRKFKNDPVNLDRIRLVNPKNRKERLQVKFIKDEAGAKKRINVKTNEEVPILKKHRTYMERALKRKEGPKDTPNEVRLMKTYKGEDFEAIAVAFIRKIKHKEDVESRLILRD